MFRWSLPASSPRGRWDEPRPQRNSCRLTVQADEKRPGRVAQCSVFWTDGTPVTPEAVAIVVRSMLAAGWNPDQRGPAFVLKDGVDVDRLDVRNTRERLVREVLET